MKKAPCIFCTVLENGQQKTTVRVHRGSIPVSIMLTLQTCFAGFVPTAGRLIVTLQAKTIVSDVGSLKAQSTVDVTVVNRTKPFFEFCIVTNAEYHVFQPPPTAFLRPHPTGRYLQHFHPARQPQSQALNSSRFACRFSVTW